MATLLPTMTGSDTNLSVFLAELVQANLEQVPAYFQSFNCKEPSANDVPAPSYTIEERNTFALASLRRATPMLRRFAYNNQLDFEELYQMAAEVALKGFEKARKALNPPAYIQTAIRNMCFDQLGAKKTRRKFTDFYEVCSLDAPLTKDPNSGTLLDIVALPTPVPHEKRDYTPLYGAIATLPDIYRTAIILHSGLLGNHPHSYEELAQKFNISVNNAHVRFAKAIRMLSTRLDCNGNEVLVV